MRTSLIIFGVIFLVIGALLYFVPMQEFKANTTTSEGGNVDNRTSSANITIPIAYAYGSAAIGLILLILGFAIHGKLKIVQGPRGPRGRVSAKKPTPKRRKKRALEKGTSVTKTTKTVRR